ncbi:MAG: hypothetical protein ACI9TV_000053 [Sulfurimonas sp.]|jgi:hypothetical protein
MNTTAETTQQLTNISFFTTMSLFSISLIVSIIFVFAFLKGIK